MLVYLSSLVAYNVSALKAGTIVLFTFNASRLAYMQVYASD